VGVSKPITKELEMKKIKMTKEQKEQFKHLIRERGIARLGCKTASELFYETEDMLWKRLRKIWPTVKEIHHPERGDWTVTVCSEDEKKPE
jgi:hypothetical protein